MPSNSYPYVYFELPELGEAISFRNLSSDRLPEFYKSFDAVIKKDSPGKDFGFNRDFLNIGCIDMDYVVNALGGNQNSSMDTLIRIGNYDAITAKFSNLRWLMVEFKLNSREARTRNDKDDLEQKVKDTLSYIECGSMDPKRIFIYPNSVVGVKKRKFKDWKNGSNKQIYEHWECYSPKELENFLLLSQNIPYKEINTADKILATFPGTEDIDVIDKQFDYWRSRADEYNIRGNRREYEHILSVLAKYFRDLMEELENLDKTEERDLLSFVFDWDFLEKFLQSENE